MSDLGISPVNCPDTTCCWAAHGIPDKYSEARAWHLAAHRAEERGEPLTDEQIAYATSKGYPLPMPVGPEPRTLDVVEDELTGANLSLWEEEQTTARLRLALKSAKRGRRELRSALQFSEPSRERWRAAAIKAEAERDALQKRLHAAAMTRTWRNEDGKKFVFVEDIAPALLGLDTTTTDHAQEAS